jgi:hypothetical protein
VKVVPGEQEHIMNASASLAAPAAFAAIAAFAIATLLPAQATAHFIGGYSSGEYAILVHRTGGPRQTYDASDWYVRMYGPYYYGYVPTERYYDSRYSGIRAAAPPDDTQPDALRPGSTALKQSCLSKSHLQAGALAFAEERTNETPASAPPGAPTICRWSGVEK